MPIMPPTSKFSGPPPGATPQGLTSMLPPPEEQAAPEALPSDQPNPAGGAGGLKDVYDELSSVLDSLAEILPNQAMEIDEIKSRLAEVLGKAISGGAEFSGRTQSTGQLRSGMEIPV